MRPLKIKVSITLDEDVLKQAKELSENDDRSLSQYINLILKTHIGKDIAKSGERSRLRG